MNLSNVTGLGRAVDPRIPSNLLAIIATGSAGIIIALTGWVGSGTLDPMATITGAITVFVAWAIGRELDPDNPISAALAMAGTLVIAVFGSVEAGGAVVMLLALRFMVGSVGVPLKVGDYLALVLAAGYAGTKPELWAAAGAIVIAFLLNRPRWFAWAAGAALGAAVWGALLWSPGVTWDVSAAGLGVGALGVLAALASLPGVNVRSRTDSGNRIISSSRVVLARATAGVVIAVASLISVNSFPAVAPVLVVIASVAAVGVMSPRSDRSSRSDISPTHVSTH